MSLRDHWKQKHGLTLMQLKRLETERLMEQLVRNQEQAMFDAIEAEPRLLRELAEERRYYIDNIERRITNGWQPSSAEWLAIEINLQVLEKRRKAIADPYGLEELNELREQRKRIEKLYTSFMVPLIL